MGRWDTYFLNICNAVGSNSKCLSRQIGSILVRDKTIVATGYNGPPRGVPHCGHDRIVRDDKLSDAIAEWNKNSELGHELLQTVCPRKLLGFHSGQGLEWCIAAHAERNCICAAAKEGVKVDGCTLYLNDIVPCKDCLIEIINSGIAEVVCTKDLYYDNQSLYIRKHSGIKIRTFQV